jgi:hypothetical protein
MRRTNLNALILALFAAGCGGGGSSSGGAGTGTISVRITDAPIDGVAEVWVEFDGITLKPADGEQDEYTFAARSINLKELTDGKTLLLFDQEVPAGNYNWMKLHVNAEFDGIFDSYVVEDGGGQIELRVPPGRLKLGNGFTVTANGNSAFVIEWNLRMGLTNPVGQPGYKLQPSLRITDMNEWGTIAGTVLPERLPPVAEACTSDMNTGDGNVVYIYAGSDVVPDDIDGSSPEPLTTADVRLDDASGEYQYMAPFLSPGDYTVAFTCQGRDDRVPDQDQPELDVDDDLDFTPGINARVTDGETTNVDFAVPTF